MAELTEFQRRRERNYLLVMLSLGIICAGLAVIMVMALRGAAGVKDDADMRRLLTQLGWTAMALMVGSLVLLVWAIIRMLGGRVAAPMPKEPKTQRIDAWAEAGRRIQVDDDDEDEYPEGSLE